VVGGVLANAGLNDVVYDTSSEVMRTFAFTQGSSGSTLNTKIIWGLAGYGGTAFVSEFNPFPGNAANGLHVFAPNVKLVTSASGSFVAVVMSYQQSSLNASFSLPSTSYAYYVRGDPVGTLRLPKNPLIFNGLSNPQKLTSVNMTNPIFSGLVVLPPGQNEFSIFGPGNAQGGQWSFINQDFRIQGERFTRTFTLTDGCGSVSCVQEIYLNSTRSLILTCPATYYGSIYQGNGTYLSPSVTGNATTYIGSPCGTPTLTFTTENPPTNNVQEFSKRDELITITTNENPIVANLGNPIEGHMMGSIGQFTDLPLPPMTENQTETKKRSVTWARDWTQQVGYFGSTYNVSRSNAFTVPWISALETNGVLRYAIYKTNESFALLQHDYNNISGSAHFFNPGEVFTVSSVCNIVPGALTTVRSLDIKWDLSINRFVFVYSKASGLSNKICLVISNTSDFFNGGGVGYEIDLPYNFTNVERLQFSVNGDLYSFCFDDTTQNVTKNADLNYTGALYWGNCFALERARIITGVANPRLCPLQLNMFNLLIGILNYTIRTTTQTTSVANIADNGIATGAGYVNVYILKYPGHRIYYFGTANANTTFWDFNLPCEISVPYTQGNVIAPVITTSINFVTTSVPVYQNGLFAAAIGSVYSIDLQDPVFQAIAWNIIDQTNTQNTKIGISVLSTFAVFTITFDPYPGNYTHGVHVFNPTIRILSNKSGVVISYQQSTLNPNLALPSTSYAYWLNSDPKTAFRPAEYPLRMNNLANPQRLTAVNMTNPVNTGLTIPPFPTLGFSIFGPGDATSAGQDSWSFINQNFQIAGERWTRTFTLSDACGNTSCVQEIYLNATTFNNSNT
jgi:hypothetical protein